MSSGAAFDYYAELGIEQIASAQEITEAYRRLAMDRHPDRNPNNPTATASFQRLQAAYETLGDPNRKVAYDASRARARPWEAANEADVRAREQQRRAHFMDMVAREFMARQEAALEAEERRRAEKKEAAERKAAAEATAQAERAGVERAQQETRWTSFKAVTSEDRRNACLHSQFEGWAKAVHQRKARCEERGGKRSMTTFGCPYCELMVCPMCRERLAKEKRKLEKK
ncbi:DnaJ and TPR domain protein [Apiospora phragmitis]|uniref:DnaJ and TPR domain protein n=1 Tax=Apiospora phragmitis TaxID=2905665 RepID=A0ABR1WWD8_9PEZI